MFVKSQDLDEQAQQPTRKRQKTALPDGDFDHQTDAGRGRVIAGENFEVKAELFDKADSADDEEASYPVIISYR